MNTRGKGPYRSILGLMILSAFGAFGQANTDPDANVSPTVISTNTTGGITYELIKTQIPDSHPGCPVDQYAVKIAGHDQAIPLGRRKEGSIPQGFDESSLAWTPLSDTLLQITWQTLPMGDGENIDRSTLLLAKENDVWRILFRDTMAAAVYSSSINDRHETTLTFEQRGKVLYLVRKNNVARPNPEFFGTFIREWPCTMESGKLRCLDGKEKLDTSGQSLPLKSIAAHACPALTVDALRRLNPSLDGVNQYKGMILLNDKIAPYTPDESLDHYGGSQ